MNIRVHASFQIKMFVFPDIYVGMELLDCMVVLFSGFKGICIQFSIVAAPIYILTLLVGMQTSTATMENSVEIP